MARMDLAFDQEKLFVSEIFYYGRVSNSMGHVCICNQICQKMCMFVIDVIEPIVFDSVLDPFNGQTVNFISKPPKIDCLAIEKIWNTTLLLFEGILLVKVSPLGLECKFTYREKKSC